MADEFMDGKSSNTKVSRKEKKRLKKSSWSEENLDDGSGISAVFVTLGIVIVWLLIVVVLVKLDIGGFGSTVLKPLIKDIPVLNMILPEDKTLINKQNTSQYGSIEDAMQQIKELELELATSQNANAEKDSTIEDLEKEVDRLNNFESNQTSFEQEKAQFYDEIVNGDSAPAINEYKKYYESIDPENAARLYKEVIQKVDNEEKLNEYAKTYGGMKPIQAAGIFETMTDDLGLVTKILNSLNAEQRGDILGAMDPAIAAKLTKLLEP